jgi:HD-GYP domain-containing protein (c-di-GMP phosphodiesterase class II)
LSAAAIEQDHQTGNESRTIIKVPLALLPDSEGIIAREVVGSGGVVILPAGVDITLFDASLGMIIKKMRNHGITHVYLHTPQQLSESEIEEIVSKVYADQDAIISKEKAKNVIHEVDALYNTFKEDEIKPEVVSSLANMGHDLTDDLLRNPSIAFSLGKVRDADEYTFIHSFNVALLSGYLANRLYPGDSGYVEKIVLGSLLHDMGKAKIPQEVLNKPGPLDAQEFQIMQRHPVLGLTLALQSGIKDNDILAVISGHHEKWSGKGYPNKRKGLEIPEAARITAVADVFDALTAKRVYKNPMSSRSAITLVLKDAGIHFDAKVARELLVGLGLYPPGSIVCLSDGRRGIVVSGNGKDLVRPVVLIQQHKKREGKATESDAPEFVDLKNSGSICITQYLGHGDKRDIEFKQTP